MNSKIYCIVLFALPGICLGQPTISGRVLNSQTGFGIVGIDLDVFDASGASVTIIGGQSVANGDYTVELPGAGTFTIRVDPSRTDGFADQYYNQVFLPSQATPITVGPSTAVSNIDFSLSIGFDLSGTIRSAGVGLANIDLDLFSSNGEFLSGYPGTSAANGSYALGAVPPGTYFLRADPDPTQGQFFLRTYFGGQFKLATATPIVVTTAGVNALDIDLAAGGTISGQVTAQSNGAPLSGLDLDIFDDAGNRLSPSATTDVNGQYEIGPVLPGNHFLRVDPTIAQGFPRTFYIDANNSAAAQAIVVSAGQVTSNIDFSLPQAGTISGLLTNASTGAPLSGIDLDCFDSLGARVDLTARSQPDGTYVFGPLAPGTYFIRGDPDPALSQFFVRTFFGGQSQLTTAAPVVVTSPGVSAIDIALPPGGTITGQVTAQAGGAPLSGIDLDIFDAAGIPLPFTAKTDVNGQYEIGPVLPGNHILRVDPTIAQGYPRTFYIDANNSRAAQTIAVSAGLATPNIDFSLPQAGTISGLLTNASTGAPLSGIDLDCFDSLGARVDLTARSQLDGTYVFGPLAPGTYFIRADPDLALGQFFVRTFFGGQSQLTTAAPVVVTSPGVSAIDIALPPGGTVSGQVTAQAGGAPLNGIDLDIFDAAGVRLPFTAKTDVNGLYEIGPVLPGNHFLRVDPTIAQGYPRTFYIDAKNVIAAQTIAVSAGLATPNIDFSLPQAGTISGLITDTGTGAPVANIDLDCFDALGVRVDLTARSQADGTYVFGPLAPGDYFLRADPSATQGRLLQFYNNAPDLLQASLVSVIGGSDIPNIDFSLSPGGWIQGVVTDAGAQPLPNIDLDLFVAATGIRVTGSARTGVDGSYIIGPVATGSYTLRCDPTIAQGYGVEYYDAKINKAAADLIFTTGFVGTMGIDFTLETGGSISGRITSQSTGLPLANIDIDVLVPGTFTRLDQSSKTDVGGNYIIGPLPVGMYLVRADPDPTQFYRRTYFGGAATAPSATPISVPSGQDLTGKDIALPDSLPNAVSQEWRIYE